MEDDGWSPVPPTVVDVAALTHKIFTSTLLTATSEQSLVETMSSLGAAVQPLVLATLQSLVETASSLGTAVVATSRLGAVGVSCSG